MIPTMLAEATGSGALDDPVAIGALAAGGLLLVYFTFIRPKAKKRRDPLATPPSTRASLASERAAERGMQTLLVELEQMSRQMGAQLDTRAARLEALIRQADERIARAEEASAALAARLAREKAAVLSDRTLASPAVMDRPAASSSSARAAGSATPASGSSSNLAALERHQEIYDMRDAGKSPAEIARRINRPAGEVELILALRPARRSGQAQA